MNKELTLVNPQNSFENLFIAMTRKSSKKRGGQSLSQSNPGTSKPKPQAQKIEASTEAQRCPYHHPILHLEPSPVRGYGQSPMQRFITQPSSQSSSLFLRPDTGKLSTSKVCLCGANNAMEKEMSKNNIHLEGAYGTKRT